jgi:peptide/nickel transport system permease protein
MSAGVFDVVPVLLWTDGLVFVLLACVLALVWFIRRQEHLRAPWRLVAQRPMAMGAALVLGAFVVIGLLDSLHYRERLADSAADTPQYSVEVLSAFDALVGRLRTQQEKTYSAPLAMQLYAKEFVERDGKTVREYPRLRYGGAHLRDASERLPDILRRGLTGLAQSLAAGLLLFALFAAWIGLGARWSSSRRCC